MSTPVELPKWADAGLIPLLNVAAAFLISGLVVLLIGENPIHAIGTLIWGAIGTPYALGYTLYYATNFIFGGLAVAVAFHAGLFNIGGEGQAYMAGLGAAIVCLTLGFLPGFILVPLAILASIAFGAVWAAVPGYLQARRGSHIVITTIMFNWLSTALMGYLLVKVLIEPGSMQPQTREFPANSHIAKFTDVFGAIGVELPDTPLNLTFILAVLCAIGVWLLIWRTRLGYEIRTVGINPTAATYGGIAPSKIIVVAMAISGGLAAGIAVNEILGVQNRLLLEFTQGYGFVGIAVALMGRGHPLGIVLASILFGMLYQGGTELAFDSPKITRDMIVVIQGLVVLFAGALESVFKQPLSWLLKRRR